MKEDEKLRIFKVICGDYRIDFTEYEMQTIVDILWKKRWNKALGCKFAVILYPQLLEGKECSDEVLNRDKEQIQKYYKQIRIFGNVLRR